MNSLINSDAGILSQVFIFTVFIDVKHNMLTFSVNLGSVSNKIEHIKRNKTIRSKNGQINILQHYV